VRAKPDWTPAFLKLQKRMTETQKGSWVPVSKKIQNKYSNITLTGLCRFKNYKDYTEYIGETEDGYINVKTFINFVSIITGETEYDLQNDIEVVGAINDDRNITIEEIIYYLNWNKPKNYLELD
jgi:hypothetical protein